MHGYRDSVRIIDLLTHAGGFRKRTGRDESVGYAENKTAFALSLFPDSEPGAAFEYSNEGVQLLEPIIAKLTGKSTDEFANDVIFRPIGMSSTRLYSYGGSPWVYADMQTTPRDLARLGLLMKNGGRWGTRQVISPEYILRATAPSTQSEEMGFLWDIEADIRIIRTAPGGASGPGFIR